MTDWNRFFSADQLRNAIRALAAPSLPTATGFLAVLVLNPSDGRTYWLTSTSTAT